MKRRLDLALALVHRPRILFLDEPTTGLDPQSRADLWEEVARLAREDGVTVFLTTQYLEEADVLADRVGIIDHGQIVAEGTPEALKAEIGRPTRRGRCPAERRRPRRGSRRVLARFGAAVAGAARARPRCGSSGGDDELADGRARARRRGPRASPTSSCTSRRSTTSSSPRPAASSRAPRRPTGEPRGGAGVSDARSQQVGEMARRSVLADAAPAGADHPADRVPADPAGGQRRRPRRGDASCPGFPTDTYLDFAIAVPFIQGALFASINAGHEPRARHRDRLPQPPRADAAAARRAADRPARAA